MPPYGTFLAFVLIVILVVFHKPPAHSVPACLNSIAALYSPPARGAVKLDAMAQCLLGGPIGPASGTQWDINKQT
jgi:hypothetical protein